ncbi:unnamed protein product [Prunus armeniaca]
MWWRQSEASNFLSPSAPAPRRTFIYTHFLVVDCLTTYNAIIGKPALTRMKAILSSPMLLLKFPTHSGVGQRRGEQLSTRVCYVSSTRESATRVLERKAPESLVVSTMTMLNGKEESVRPDDPRDKGITLQAQPIEELETIPITDTQDRIVQIGTSLSLTLRTEFIAFLRANSEGFAWSYNNMSSISLDVICHKLSISSSVKPV